MLEIKLCDPSLEAYEEIVPIFNAVHTLWPKTAAEAMRWDSVRDPNLKKQRWIGLLDGKPAFAASTGHSEHMHRAGRRSIDVCGLDETRGTEAEKAFFEDILERVMEDDPYEIVSVLRNDQASMLKLFSEHGFVQRQYDKISILDLDDFHPEAWTGALDHAVNQGIELLSYQQIMETIDEPLRAIYDLVDVLFRDVPQPDSVTMDTYEVFENRMKTSPYDTSLRWYARKDGRLIGQTAIINNLADPTMGYTGLTGVVRDFRRYGVATAVKVKSLTAAKAMGMKYVQTENEENNPMFDLNVRLGFVERYGWLQFVKSLREPTEADLVQDFPASV